MKMRLLCLSREERESAARNVDHAIGSSWILGRCRYLGLYAAQKDELSLAPLATRLSSQGKQVLWPRIAGRFLEFAPGSIAGLVPGRFDILAPADDTPRELLGSQDLVLLPGIAFDRFGGRLGRGRGYYDRTFPSGVPSPILIGVGYSFQVISEVPTNKNDRRVHAIVTENGLQWSLSSEHDIN